MARAKVFTDDDGNRMVLPWLIFENKEDEPLSTTLWTYATRMACATGLKMEDGWLKFEPDDFPHVVVNILSRGFEHGGGTVYMFSGPKFDEIAGI